MWVTNAGKKRIELKTQGRLIYRMTIREYMNVFVFRVMIFSTSFYPDVTHT